jgi:cytochrome P450
MKFALVEMKLALVRLLRTFEIHPSENTPKNLQSSGNILRRPSEHIYAKFIKRN